MRHKWQRTFSTVLLVLGVLLILAGAGVWIWESVLPDLRFRSADADGDGVVLAAKLDTSDVDAASEADAVSGTGLDLQPTFTPVPTETPTVAPTETAAPSTTPEPTETPEPTDTPAPTPTPTPGDPPASEPPTRLVAPAINLDADVVAMGWEVKQNANGESYSEWIVPGYAAGWHKNSELPGRNGNTVLSGHHNIEGEVFRYLKDLEPGAEVTLYADGYPYRYIVTEKYIVREKGVPYEQRLENAKLINETQDERLTLVTCWPYETNTHRVVVIAKPLTKLQANAQ